VCREHRNNLLLAFDQRPFVPDLIQGFVGVMRVAKGCRTATGR
jgi:hypothetical protein